MSLNVGGISFKRQSMVCEGEREKGRWKWGEGAMVPGKGALAKTPIYGRVLKRLPSPGCCGAAICPARSLPLPTPTPPQNAFPAGGKPPSISKSTLWTPLPLLHQEREGKPCTPTLCWSKGNRGPNLALKRAGLAPLSPSREGRGANPFRT